MDLVKDCVGLVQDCVNDFLFSEDYNFCRLKYYCNKTS